MAKTLIEFSEELREKKKHYGATWIMLINLGLQSLENTKQENTRVRELEEYVRNLERNIGKLQELLRKPGEGQNDQKH